MKEENGTMKTRAGKQVYTKTWLPETEPRADIILVHGLGEYCERYQHVAEFLTGIGCAVYSFDHPGHGKSEGKRGCMCYADAFDIRNRSKGSSPPVPRSGWRIRCPLRRSNCSVS